MAAKTYLEKPSTFFCRSLTSTAAHRPQPSPFLAADLTGANARPSGFSGGRAMQEPPDEWAAVSCLPDLEDSGGKQKPPIKAFNL